MRFDSESVLLRNRGIKYQFPIESPPSLKNYIFTAEVIESAIKNFNKYLDKRSRITVQFDDIKVDVLRIVPSENFFALWVVLQEKDIDDLHQIHFTIGGEVIFAKNSEIIVDKMIIKDVLYDGGGIFGGK